MKATTGPPTHAVWTISKAGILAKTVRPATAWREATAVETIGTSQRQQQKGDQQQQY
jgi:DNA-binding transcriptional regulator YdaS (Cro superfamily)